MKTKLDGIAEKARSEPHLRFTALAHLITPEFLMESWRKMNRNGASGVDKETAASMGEHLETRCVACGARMVSTTETARLVHATL